MSLHHHGTTSLHHCVSKSFALPPATKPVSHLPCPLPPNQSVICLAPCHQTSQSFDLPSTTASLCHCITTSPRHCITVSVSHLPCPLPPSQSVICLAPCHQTSQSFALPPATKPVSHLTCPLALHHCVTMSLHHHITASLCQSVICLAPCHQTSQSFALPPATKPVSHLTCPLPPHHHVIVAPCHHVTAALHHCITASPHQSVICLAPCHQTSQSFALPPATKPVSHLTCPLPLHHRIIMAPHHRITTALHHCITTSPHQSVICLAPCHPTSQSFALSPATKPVSHLTCPLLLCHHVTASPHHRITTSVSHLPCSPATKPVSHLHCPCHQTSQSFDLASTTTSPHDHGTTSPCHCSTASLHHCITTSVSHLPCPLPPNQSVICLALYHYITVSLHHCITTSPCHRSTASLWHRVIASLHQSVICLAPCHQINVKIQGIIVSTAVTILKQVMEEKLMLSRRPL